MTVEIKPETQQLMDEEIRSGHFNSVDDLIIQGVYALREKHEASAIAGTSAGPRRPAGRKSLAQLFADSPFKGTDMSFDR